MVAAGEADLSPYIARQDATDPKTDVAYLNAETSNMRIDVTTPPLNDVRVRKALNLALDREALRTAIFGEDTVAAAQLVTEAVFGYNPDLKPWPYDPEEARRLIAAAKADGVDVDVPMKIIARPGIYPNASEAVEALMAMWSEVGLNFTAQNFEIADWLKYLRKPFPENVGPNVQQEQHDNGKGDAIFTVFNKYHSKGTVSKLGDPKLDALIEKGQASTGDERRAAFQEVFRYLREDVVADVNLFHMVGYARVSPKISWTPNLQTNNEINLSEVTFKN
jgi:peptide/nickel transport system substrate-binding protein